MKAYQEKLFDLAVVDPPYFSGPERRWYYGSRVSKTGVHRDYPITPKWDVPGKDYFDELLRVSKHYIIWGCNYFDYHFADCEIAATDLFDSVRLFRYMWNGMMQGKSIHEGHIQQGNKTLNEKRIHPTQKPVALYSWIFQKYAKPGQMILDTHVGSGSSRIAAYDAGLYFTGFEISQEYFLLQKERYKAYTAQTDMFHAEGVNKCESNH